MRNRQTALSQPNFARFIGSIPLNVDLFFSIKLYILLLNTSFDVFSASKYILWLTLISALMLLYFRGWQRDCNSGKWGRKREIYIRTAELEGG